MSPQVPYVPDHPGGLPLRPSVPSTPPDDAWNSHVHSDFRPSPVKRRRTGWIIAGVVLGVLALGCGGAGLLLVAGTVDSASKGVADGRNPGLDPGAPVVSDGPSRSGAFVPSVTAPPPAAAVATIGDGTWTAGADFPAGTYEVTSDAKLCAWQVYTGQEPDVTYVDPGHVGPGHYRFTFKAGQHLMTSGCGTWRKAG